MDPPLPSPPQRPGRGSPGRAGSRPSTCPRTPGTSAGWGRPWTTQYSAVIVTPRGLARVSLKILTVAVSEDFQNVEVLFEELSLHRIVQILNGMVPEHAPYGDYLLVTSTWLQNRSPSSIWGTECTSLWCRWWRRPQMRPSTRWCPWGASSTQTYAERWISWMWNTHYPRC